MSSPPRAFFGCHERRCVIKFVGELRYTVAPNVGALLDELFARRDFDDIIIDLRPTTLIDSTGLGLLARVGTFMRSELDRTATIACDRADVVKSLTSVGFHRVFNLVEQPEVEDEELQEMPTAGAGERELAMNVLAAHHALMDLDEENERTFRGVVDALEQELQGETRSRARET